MLKYEAVVQDRQEGYSGLWLARLDNNSKVNGNNRNLNNNNRARGMVSCRGIS